MPPKDPPVVVTLRIPRSLRAKLRVRAKAEGRTVNGFIRWELQRIVTDTDPRPPEQP